MLLLKDQILEKVYGMKGSGEKFAVACLFKPALGRQYDTCVVCGQPVEWQPPGRLQGSRWAKEGRQGKVEVLY